MGLFAGLPIVSLAQTLFDDQVHEIDLSFSQSGFLDSLDHHYAAKEYLRAQLSIDGELVGQIGARYKGNSSYSFYPGPKKSFKLDLNEFVPGQSYQGLKKLNLHNAYLDPTFLREKLAYDLFQELGVAAPRCGFARLKVNGEDYGLYVLVEQVDKTFLRRHFDDDQGDLFKAIRGANLQQDSPVPYQAQYEVKQSIQPDPWPDLAALIEAINQASIPELSQSFALPAYLKIWALDNVLTNLDSYLHSGHNYYLYRDASSDRFYWIPWDYNTAFGTALCDFPCGIAALSPYYHAPETSKPLLEKLLASPTWKAMYVAELRAILALAFSEAMLVPRIDSLARLIRPHVYKDTLQMFDPQAFERGLHQDQVYLQQETYHICIPGLKPFIKRRYQYLDSVLTNWATIRPCLPLRDPSKFALAQNEPNPMIDNTRIRFQVPANMPYVFRVLDNLGRRVWQQSGLGQGQEETIQLEDQNFSAGVYVYSLSTAGKRIWKRMLVSQ